MNVHELVAPFTSKVTMDDLKKEVDKLDEEQGVIIKNNKLSSDKIYQMEIENAKSILISMILLICKVDPSKFVSFRNGKYIRTREISFKDSVFIKENILWNETMQKTPQNIYSRIYRGKIFSLFLIYLMDNLEMIIENRLMLIGDKDQINYEEKRELMLSSIMKKVHEMCDNVLEGSGASTRQSFMDMFYLCIFDTHKRKKLVRRDAALESIRYNLEILTMSVSDDIYQLPDDAILNNIFKLAYQIMTLDDTVKKTPALDSGMTLNDVDKIYDLMSDLGRIIMTKLGNNDLNEFVSILEFCKPIRPLPSKVFKSDKKLNIGYKAIFFVMIMIWDEEVVNKIFKTFMKY